MQAQAEGTLTRFETPPGQQSQVDWGQSRVRGSPVKCYGAIDLLVHDVRGRRR